MSKTCKSGRPVRGHHGVHTGHDHQREQRCQHCHANGTDRLIDPDDSICYIGANVIAKRCRDHQHQRQHDDQREGGHQAGFQEIRDKLRDQLFHLAQHIGRDDNRNDGRRIVGHIDRKAKNRHGCAIGRCSNEAWVDQQCAQQHAEALIRSKLLRRGCPQKDREEVDKCITQPVEDLVGRAGLRQDACHIADHVQDFYHSAADHHGDQRGNAAGNGIHHTGQESFDGKLFLFHRVQCLIHRCSCFQSIFLADCLIDLADCRPDNDLQFLIGPLRAQHFIQLFDGFQIDLFAVFQIEAQTGSAMLKIDDIFLAANRREQILFQFCIFILCH